MFLALDIGNTNMTMGVFDGDEIVFVTRIATNRSKESDEYAVQFKDIFSLYETDISLIDGCAISSVVPELLRSISGAVEKAFGIKPMIIGPGIKTGMNIKIDNPAQLGSDLLAGCVGAKSLYPLPCLVIDSGTAVKVSVIDKSGSFRGCAIAPGVRISLQALSAGTSMLPNISLTTPDHAIGTNTLDSMTSGTVFGFASLIDGLCDKCELELNEGPVFAISTGGLAKDLVKSCRRKIEYNGELVLYGLKIIYDKNKQ